MTTPVSGLLTTYGSLTQVELNYFFTAASTGAANLQPSTVYFAIGKVDQWPDDNNPPAPTQDQATLKKMFKNLVAAKLVLTSNLAAVVPRFDWTSGTVYDRYDNTSTTLFDNNNFYVITEPLITGGEYYVYKCIDNNDGGASTVNPSRIP